MSDASLANLVYDIPLSNLSFVSDSYILDDIGFAVTEYGNLQPLCILYNETNDPDPCRVIYLANTDVLFKKNLLLGDVVDDNLNLIYRPTTASPVIIPTRCPQCDSPLDINHSRKLLIKCVPCSISQYHQP
jgi:hypothetical protein